MTPRNDGLIRFVDLGSQQSAIKHELAAAIERVMAHAEFISGPECAELEAVLARRAGVPHALTCASGTDAITLILMALGIGPGDAVICPAFTFTATPEAPALLGATPVLADVLPDTFCINPDDITPAADAARKAGLRPRVVIAADLYGLPADYASIEKAAESEGMVVLADAAQSFGGAIGDRQVGSFGIATALSFFPSKPLGCYGDGGAVLTRDPELALVIDSLRVHGRGAHKYDNVRVGLNSRLDTLQAAILLQKLRIFNDELLHRQRVASAYDAGLCGVVSVPPAIHGYRSAWAQYTIKVPGGRRDSLSAFLKGDGIPTAIYYPRPIHHQTAYATSPIARSRLVVSEELSGEVLSLPMHPYLNATAIEYISRKIASHLSAR